MGTIEGNLERAREREEIYIAWLRTSSYRNARSSFINTPHIFAQTQKFGYYNVIPLEKQRLLYNALSIPTPHTGNITKQLIAITDIKKHSIPMLQMDKERSCFAKKSK